MAGGAGGARGAGRARASPASGSPARCTGSCCSTSSRTCCGPAILWNDQRTAAECAEIEERVGLERLIALTGNRALTGFTAPKLLWLRRPRAGVYAAIAHVLLPKDYVRLRLTGERATDVADASGTLLFDVAGRRWSDGGARAARAPAEPAAASARVAGVVGRDAAPAIPVAAGAGDQAAGALGVGVDRPGPLSVQIGTSGVVFAALPAFQADPQARVHAFCHAVPGRLARDGRDALRRGLPALAPRRRRSRQRVTTSWSR